ncbi:Rha family regulatory protein [Vibrio phage LP.2]|nr:Rha family regulatory protein [Vibrio phage LP.2]
MNDLVVMHEGKQMVSSQLVADKFGKAHRDIIRAIRNLDCSEEFKVRNFAQCFFKNKMNREYEGFMMTRDGFSFLCMGFTGKKAAEWKEAFINAFNSMERQILQKQDSLEWKQARLQSKSARRSFTDVVKEFVDYATNQGSRSAGMYYMNITKMEYAALELTEKGQKLPKDFRDTLDCMDLCFLSTAEQVAKNSLQQGMEMNLHYKEIYQLAKERVFTYAETVKLPRLN